MSSCSNNGFWWAAVERMASVGQRVNVHVPFVSIKSVEQTLNNLEDSILVGSSCGCTLLCVWWSRINQPAKIQPRYLLVTGSPQRWGGLPFQTGHVSQPQEWQPLEQEWQPLDSSHLGCLPAQLKFFQASFLLLLLFLFLLLLLFLLLIRGIASSIAVLGSCLTLENSQSLIKLVHYVLAICKASIGQVYQWMSLGLGAWLLLLCFLLLFLYLFAFQGILVGSLLQHIHVTLAQALSQDLLGFRFFLPKVLGKLPAAASISYWLDLGT